MARWTCQRFTAEGFPPVFTWSGVKGANVQTWDPGHESDIQQPADVSMCLLFICSISRTTSGKGQEGWTYWRSIRWVYQILSIVSIDEPRAQCCVELRRIIWCIGLWGPLNFTQLMNGQEVPEDVSTVPVCIVQVKCSISEALWPRMPQTYLASRSGTAGELVAAACPFQEVTLATSFWSWGKYLDISDGASRPFLGTVLELFNGLSEQLRFQHLAIQGSNLAWTRCQWAHKTCSHLWYWQINSQIPTVWNTTKPTVIIGSTYFGGPYWGVQYQDISGVGLILRHLTSPSYSRPAENLIRMCIPLNSWLRTMVITCYNLLYMLI